ncbi:hypothetical protein J1614_007749 [Plenodomus biglobosus]|nr:hypothetical protein J1614_007749 [Plenodomus biglobosus]
MVEKRPRTVRMRMSCEDSDHSSQLPRTSRHESILNLVGRNYSSGRETPPTVHVRFLGTQYQSQGTVERQSVGRVSMPHWNANVSDTVDLRVLSAI